MGLVDDVLNDIAHDLAAIHAAQMLQRHFTRAETVDPDLVLHFNELGGQTLGQILRGKYHVKLALQAFRERICNLHDLQSLRS